LLVTALMVQSASVAPPRERLPRRAGKAKALAQ
jgi:hypothetical protein